MDILGRFGHFGQFCTYLDTSRHFGHLDHFWTLLDNFGHFCTVLESFEHFCTVWTVLDNLGSFRYFWCKTLQTAHKCSKVSKIVQGIVREGLNADKMS